MHISGANSEKSVHILVVDDDETIREILQDAITYFKYHCTVAENATAALKYLEGDRDIDVILIDIKMAGMNGIELCEKVKEKYDADVIIMTGGANDFSYTDAIGKGASDFINKPIDLKELHLRIKQILAHRKTVFELKISNEKQEVTLANLRKSFGSIIQLLTSITEVRDPYTAGHQRKVADLGRAIGTDLKLSDFQIEGIRLAGAVHDIGKIGVPAEILIKPSKLTNFEFDLIKTHPQVGYDLLKDVDFPWPIDRIALQHHWRLNGVGYPEPISLDEFLIESRIIGVADVVEAMLSHRPYRPALGIDKALEEIQLNKGTLYDPDVVDSCIKLFKSGEFKFNKWGRRFQNNL